VTTLQAMTSDVYNHIARTHLLTLLHLTNPQGLAFVNLAIRLSLEVQGIRVSFRPFTRSSCEYETFYLLANF
jgi:hypothetical protein